MRLHPNMMPESGPDGRGLTRMRIIGIASPECGMQPKTQEALWEMKCRTPKYGGGYAWCMRERYDCATCQNVPCIPWTYLRDTMEVRIFDGVPWIMNKPGAGEYGIPTTWPYLARLACDIIGPMIGREAFTIRKK